MCYLSTGCVLNKSYLDHCTNYSQLWNEFHLLESSYYNPDIQVGRVSDGYILQFQSNMKFCKDTPELVLHFAQDIFSFPVCFKFITIFCITIPYSASCHFTLVHLDNDCQWILSTFRSHVLLLLRSHSYTCYIILYFKVCTTNGQFSMFTLFYNPAILK